MARSISWFFALALVACGQAVGPLDHGKAKDGPGGLRILVNDLTESKVQELHLDLRRDMSAANPAPADVTIVLERDATGLGRDASGQPVVWTWHEKDLAAGAYTVTARAYNVSQPEEETKPSFQSTATPAVVRAGETSVVNIFLHQHLSESLETPHFTAIRFNREPFVGAVTRIAVWGQGGEGRLSLTGTGAGSFGSSEDGEWQGEGWDDAKGTEGASIDWVPDTHGPQVPIELTLTDEAGNWGKMVLRVDVSEAIGDADFNISFNHAPIAHVEVGSLVDGLEINVEFMARYDDPESKGELIQFEWDLSDCLDAGFSASPAPPTSGEEKDKLVGEIEADLITSHTVSLTATAPPLPALTPTCTLILKASDTGLPTDPTAISTSTRRFLVALEPVLSCIGELESCNGVCMDLRNDRNNCGVCGQVCGIDCFDRKCVDVEKLASGGLGNEHLCVLLSDGDVYCWGSNVDGRLGVGSDDEDPHPSPLRIAGVTNDDPETVVPSSLSVASRVSCMVLVDGRVACWGRYNEGSQYSGNNTFPQIITTGSTSNGQGPHLSNVRQVATSSRASCALLGLDGETDVGRVKCWGSNVYGQIGIGATANDFFRANDYIVDEVGNPLEGVVRVVGGDMVTCVIANAERQLYCWGRNQRSTQLMGIPTSSGQTEERHTRPVPIPGMTGLADVAIGSQLACALFEADGSVKCWGNADGYLGNNAQGSGASAPVDVVGEDGSGRLTGAKRIYVGIGHACALLDEPDGRALCWGANSNSQLSGPSSSRVLVPTEVKADANNPLLQIKDLFLGRHFTCALLEPGELRCWGDSALGKLGYEHGGNALYPGEVDWSSPETGLGGG